MKFSCSGWLIEECREEKSNCSGLERTLAILIATVYEYKPPKITRAQYDLLLESHFQKTLGRLIYKLRKSLPIAEDLEFTLLEALDKRNWLFHNYFWERAQKFMKEDGREAMIEELQEIAYYFEKVDHKLDMILLLWGEEHGVTEEIIQKKMENLINIE